MKPEFRAYQEQVLRNAKAMAGALMESGFDLVSGGTDNHMMLVDLRKAGVTGKELEHRLDEVNITVNKNAIPNDPEKPFVTSGIRVGTPHDSLTKKTDKEKNCHGSYISLPESSLLQLESPTRCGLSYACDM